MSKCFLFHKYELIGTVGEVRPELVEFPSLSSSFLGEERIYRWDEVYRCKHCKKEKIELMGGW